MRSACHLEMSKQQNSNPRTLGAKEIAGIIFPPPDEVRDGMWNLWTWEWQSPLIVHLVYFRPWTPCLMSFLRVSSDRMPSYPISQMSKLNPREIKQLGIQLIIWKSEFESLTVLLQSVNSILHLYSEGRKKGIAFPFQFQKIFLKKKITKNGNSSKY